MHGRGGTGAGQLVGTIESGANPDHPDLTGKFPHTCALGHCDDGRPNRTDHIPLVDTDDHGTLVNGHHRGAQERNRGVRGGLRRVDRLVREHRIDLSPGGATQCDASDEDCPSGVNEKRHQWSELFDQEIARGSDWMRSLGVRVTNLSWGRTYEWSREEDTVRTHEGLGRPHRADDPAGVRCLRRRGRRGGLGGRQRRQSPSGGRGDRWLASAGTDVASTTSLTTAAMPPTGVSPRQAWS